MQHEHDEYQNDCIACLREEIEQLRVQLAGCGVAALGGTSMTSRAYFGDYGWSPTYEDVLRLRLKYDALRAVTGYEEHKEVDEYGWSHEAVIGGRLNDDESILEDRVPELNPIGKVRGIKRVIVASPLGIHQQLIPGEIKEKIDA